MKNKLFLILIFVLALCVRLIGLSVRPAGLTWDEAAIGYNAYSLLLTGRDEHAAAFPLIFKSFGDYKPGLYIYTSVLPVAIFGLNIFATRLPSAVFGSLSVLLIYLLVKKIHAKSALYAAFLLALSPWSIIFSRGAWEANFNLFLTLLAVCLYLYRKYPLSAIFFALTLYTYQGAKLFTPLLAVGLFIFSTQIGQLKKRLLPLILVLLAALPLVLGLSNQGGRLKVFSVFSYTRSQQAISTLLSQEVANTPKFIFPLFHSEIIDQGRGVLQRFLNHLSPKYLFITGDWSNPRHSVVYQGYFYYSLLPLLIIGIVYLVKNRLPYSGFLLWWIIVAIIPSALSRDIVSGVRSLPLVIPLLVICAIGMSKLATNKLLHIVWWPIFIFFVIYFFDLYWIHNPKFTSNYWLTPYQKVVNLVSQHQSQYSHVVFTDKLGQPYIFFLFFNRVSPQEYQNHSTFLPDPNGDVGQVSSFEKYSFQPIYWPSLRNQSSLLVVGDQYELPMSDLNLPNLVNFGDIQYLDGSTALRIVGLP